MGVTPDPDPCANRCIFESFGAEAIEAYSIFARVAKRWQDPKTKSYHYEIDYAAVDVVFDAYGVTDKRRGLDVIGFIIEELTGPGMPESEIFGESVTLSADPG